MHIVVNTRLNTLRATRTIAALSLYATRIPPEWRSRTVHAFRHVRSGCEGSIDISQRDSCKRLRCRMTCRLGLWIRLTRHLCSEPFRWSYTSFLYNRIVFFRIPVCVCLDIVFSPECGHSLLSSFVFLCASSVSRVSTYEYALVCCLRCGGVVPLVLFSFFPPRQPPPLVCRHCCCWGHDLFGDELQHHQNTRTDRECLAACTLVLWNCITHGRRGRRREHRCGWRWGRRGP